MTNEVYFFADTETTGFAKSCAQIQEGQARVCQAAFILTDSEGFPLAKFSSLIKPDGWVISEGAQKVHGITLEQCEQFGVSFSTVVGMYKWLASRATLRVAHNADFDSKMLDIECAYDLKARGLADIKTHLPPWHCTMKTNTHISGGKWPKLAEAYRHFTGKEMSADAHDALVDAEACKEVFFGARARAAA